MINQLKKIKMKYIFCKKCLMPNTRPGSIFNKKGVCQACLNYKKRKIIDWGGREKELENLCDKYRRDDGYYDCIIPVSGGKDSHFLVYTMKVKMGMNPLLITVGDPFTKTKAGLSNFRNLEDRFDCNHILFNISIDLFRRATRIAFEETGEALKFIEYAIYTIPTLLAQKLDIPFVIFGENSAYEYGSTDKDFYLATPIVKSISDKLEKDKQWWIKKGLTLNEVNSIQLDKNKPLPEVIYMSYFRPWSSVINLGIAKKYGFKDLTNEWKREGCIENFEQIDSIAYMVHLWLKYPKFGFQRTSDIASRRVREGNISLSEAKKLIKENDHKLDQLALKDFIDLLKYTPTQFWDIVEKMWNREMFKKVNGLWQLKKEYEKLRDKIKC
ncbi:N-acetyl sugar amidotransferase [Patescibacteria group bacterium]|nr:N-acetyl sugar amidotransferase [Patescibacteria group bacterium]MBU2472542.1 N-acetyl sugar amidotransferase [Patescibacteria group bacterium]